MPRKKPEEQQQNDQEVMALEANQTEEQPSGESDLDASASDLELNDTFDPALDPALVLNGAIEPLPETESPPPAESSPHELEAPADPPAPKRKTRAASKKTEAAQENAADPSPAPAKPRGRREAAPRVLSIDQDIRAYSNQEKDDHIWMELRNSMRTKLILTGILGGIERLPNGNFLAIIFYKEKRIVIPASEMFVHVSEDDETTGMTLQQRYEQYLTRAMGSEVDFIVSGVDKRGNSVVASRKEALLRKQQFYYLPSQRRKEPLISVGQIVEARVTAVGDKNIRVEVFGVDATIMAREVAWEWVEDCTEYFDIGDRVVVKLLKIDLADRKNIWIDPSIRETYPNPTLENVKKCVKQGKYIGTVTGMDDKAVYLRLNIGVNAVAIAVYDRKTPSRKDSVSFVVTRINLETGVVHGIITRIIKQHF